MPRPPKYPAVSCSNIRCSLLFELAEHITSRVELERQSAHVAVAAMSVVTAVTAFVVVALAVRGVVACIGDVLSIMLPHVVQPPRRDTVSVPDVVVITKTGGKFHHPTCGDVRSKQGTQSVTPCSKCDVLFVAAMSSSRRDASHTD
jgi:hypothetical protein